MTIDQLHPTYRIPEDVSRHARTMVREVVWTRAAAASRPDLARIERAIDRLKRDCRTPSAAAFIARIETELGPWRAAVEDAAPPTGGRPRDVGTQRALTFARAVGWHTDVVAAVLVLWGAERGSLDSVCKRLRTAAANGQPEPFDAALEAWLAEQDESVITDPNALAAAIVAFHEATGLVERQDPKQQKRRRK